MNSSDNLSEWVRISIDEQGLDRSDLEEIERRLSSTIHVCVLSLKGIAELFQMLPDIEQTIEVDGCRLSGIGFLIEELTETLNMCQELNGINIRRQVENQCTNND